MTDSIRDLAATIAGLKEQAGRLRAAVSETKDTADDLTDRFRSMSVQGGPAARLSGCSSGHERAISQLEAIEGRLERARFIAMAAISGLRAPTTRALSGDQTDDPTTWDKPTPGTELVKPAKRGKLSSLTRSAMSEETMDSAKSLGNSLGKAAEAFRREFGPPMQGTQSEAQVPSTTKVHAAQQPTGAGEAAMAIVALAVVVAKGQQSITSTLNRWTGRKREQNT